MVALATEADDAPGFAELGMAQSSRWWDPQRHPFSFLALPPGTNGVPLLDARAVHTDPDPLDRDLAAASKTLGQKQVESRWSSTGPVLPGTILSKNRATFWGLEAHPGARAAGGAARQPSDARRGQALPAPPAPFAGSD